MDVGGSLRITTNESSYLSMPQKKKKKRKKEKDSEYVNLVTAMLNSCVFLICFRYSKNYIKKNMSTSGGFNLCLTYDLYCYYSCFLVIFTFFISCIRLLNMLSKFRPQ